MHWYIQNTFPTRDSSDQINSWWLLSKIGFEICWFLECTCILFKLLKSITLVYMYFILILISFVSVFLLSCSDVWKLLLNTEEMMDCQNSSGPGGGHIWGGELLVFWGVCLFVHWKLWFAALRFTKKDLNSLSWPFSALQLEPVMDLGTEELKSSINNSVIQVSNQLRVRLRRIVTLCTFPCCFRRSHTCKEPRAGVSWLCCTGLRLLGSFSCLGSFCSCRVCAWLQVDLSLKLKLAVAWAASASFS